jgi:hypothetical protein
MFGWFKKCQHLKNAGDKYPSNMKVLYRFSPHKNDTIGYGVHECVDCGKRVFSCVGCHSMYDSQARVIDEFIAYRITEEVFVEFLTKEMKWFKKDSR